jgi:predicted RND superfamily exporter protein
LVSRDWKIKESAIAALRETGVSMFYTSVILFFGFGIFVLSGFGGTKALGMLVSLTLLIAMMANLVLLPTLLMTLNKILLSKSLKEPLFEVLDEEEDIELADLEIKK